MKISAFVLNGLFILLTAAALAQPAAAQGSLDKVVPVHVTRQPLAQVLEILSNRGHFYFSYNSSIIPRDSLVSISATNQSVRQILEQLFREGYEFRESGNYIIIRRAPVKITLVTTKAYTEDRQYVVSGYVLDDHTGLQIANASIYEKRLLLSALTNAEGYFKIRLKSKVSTAALTVSKEFYEDTTVVIDPKYNQQITVTLLPVGAPDVTIIQPDDYFVPDSLRVRVTTPTGFTEYTYVKADSARVEKTQLGNFLLSAAQKMQSLNLKKFFTARPFQVSLTPGLSTNGKLSGQVINNFSLNVFGGYAGGVNGVEVGGLFNIDKKNVQFVQVGGLFNIVGGRIRGVQVGGLNNTVLGAGDALQVAGISNLVRGHFNGLQLGGVYNHAAGKVNGLQVAGISNFAREKVSGLQLAGIGNISNRAMSGVQVAGIFNYAKEARGLQVGLINIAGQSDGLGIGLINIVFRGYHKLAFSANELMPYNAAFKTGTRRLYNILQAGMQREEGKKVYAFGYGFGSALMLGKWLSVNPEVTASYLYLGTWDDANILGRAGLHLHLHLGRRLSLFGGPAFNAYYTQQDVGFSGYRFPVPPAGRRTYDLHNRVTGWTGWSAGIHLF